MINKRTIIDQIEVARGGTVGVRFRKEVVEDGLVLMSEFHRTSIVVDGSVAAQIGAVNAHLSAMNCETVAEDEIGYIRAICEAAWSKTREGSAIFLERQAESAERESSIAATLTAAAERIAQLEGIVQARVQEIAELQKLKA